MDKSESVDFYYDGFKVHHDFTIDKFIGEKYVIEGSEGNITVPFFHMTNKAELKNNSPEVFKMKDKKYERQFSLVAEEVRAGLKNSEYAKKENTIACMEMMDECRKQMKLVYPCEMNVDLEKNYAVTLSHLGFNCKNLEKSISFYRDILGCKEKFTMTYGDMVDDIKKKAREKGEKEPFYVKGMEKMRDTKWSVYMSWSDNTFIELFYIPRARRNRVPNPADDLNYTHYSLQVSDLKAFREQVIARGGEPYIDRDIEMGMDNTWVMWMKDHDGNPFEIMEYTNESYQVKGR